jgi:hypothetical protein
LNDIPDGHYGNALPALAALNTAVEQILPDHLALDNPTVACGSPYPQSIEPGEPSGLTQTLAHWTEAASARIGFLDPMRYRVNEARPGETSSADHRTWLSLIANDFGGPVIAVHFTGHRDHPTLNAEVTSILNDGQQCGYQHAVVAQYATYRTIALVRDPHGQEAADARARMIAAAAEEQFCLWLKGVGTRRRLGAPRFCVQS